MAMSSAAAARDILRGGGLPWVGSGFVMDKAVGFTNELILRTKFPPYKVTLYCEVHQSANSRISYENPGRMSIFKLGSFVESPGRTTYLFEEYFYGGGATMPHSEMNSLRHSDLNPFLFADVGTEPSGMALTVSSLFARRGQDPWREAGYLAGLPKAAAEDRFAATIATMPTGSWQLADAKLIADRLLPLLPRRTGPGAGSHVSIPFWSRLVWAMLLATCAAASAAIGVGLAMN